VDTKEQVAEFEKLEQQLHSFLDEISELSKKKPNDPINKFKLGFINSSLASLNRILGDYKPLDDFTQFNPDDLPSNSDVMLILGQYAAAAYNLRRRHTIEVSYEKWAWIVRGKAAEIETKNPDAAKYKP
jgi:hypothetical protein